MNDKFVSILCIEPGPDGEDTVVGRDIPAWAWNDLIKVAKWVSRGKSFAVTPDPDPTIGNVYPDASARRALGALHDAGLLDSKTAPTRGAV